VGIAHRHAGHPRVEAGRLPPALRCPEGRTGGVDHLTAVGGVHYRNLIRREQWLPHVDADPRPARSLRRDIERQYAAAGLDRHQPRRRPPAGHHEMRHAPHAIAAHLRLTPVGVKHPHPTRGHGRRHHQHKSVAAHAEMPVGNLRRKGRRVERGRQPTADSLRAIADLLAGKPLERAMLLEYLHRIQDRFGGISAQHIAALAHHMRLSMAEIYEVASFYAHLDVHREDEEAPPPLTVRVCDSLPCQMAGAEAVFAEIAAGSGQGVRVVRAPCMGRCDTAPVVEVGRNHLGHATASAVGDAIRAGETSAALATPNRTGDSAYATLDNVLAGTPTTPEIIATLDDAGLRGLGGAGFPAARKWQFVLAEPRPRILVVNADEGEPGTFKDRHYMEAEPRRVLEGTMIAAHAIEADEIYIYLRDEYPQVYTILDKEIAALRASRSDLPRITVRRGAGAYICGEESAMLESI